MLGLDAVAVLPPALLNVADSTRTCPHDDALWCSSTRVGGFAQHAIELGLLLGARLVDDRLRQDSDRDEHSGS